MKIEMNLQDKVTKDNNIKDKLNTVSLSALQ